LGLLILLPPFEVQQMRKVAILNQNKWMLAIQNEMKFWY